MRLSEIMRADPAARKPKRRWLYVALVAALIPTAAIQFAWAQGTNPADTPLPGSAATAHRAQSPSLVAPVAGPISEGFGARSNPKSGQMTFHEGVDFLVAAGTPVHASAGGKVSAVDEQAGYGKVVEIDHGDGLMTRYAHLDTQQVAAGDTVKAGQVIGTSGDTGSGGIGPHLHFEVWKDGEAVNPAPLLPTAG